MNWIEWGKTIAGGAICTPEQALAVLQSADDELLEVMQAAFEVRRRYFGRGVVLQVLRNAKSGQCSEDCAFCSQSAHSTAPIVRYPLQAVDDIVQGAREARTLGALRYCVVLSGRSPADATLDAICEAAQRIKREAPIQLCTSLGLITRAQAERLKAVGVDRFNHNLETSARFFPSICQTHTHADRVATATAVKQAGLELCCGGLFGMGETLEDRVDLALALRTVGADSIPLNFLDPRPGTRLEGRERIRPMEALRVLAMVRLVNPDREIRAAGGREACLGPLQALALYAANSLFTNGYLTTDGQGHAADLKLIESAGFYVAGLTVG